jgi:histidinol-phosphatase
MSDSIPSLEEVLELARRAAQSVSADILVAFLDPSRQHVERKADNSVVTRADKDAEGKIRAFLASAPNHVYPVLGEEMGDTSKGARFRWTVDPIDGTLSYTRGIPNFGTLLAFEDALVPRALVGVIHLPVSGETYSAARGSGSSCNGEAVRVAPRRGLNECVVSLSSARDFEKTGELEGYLKVCRQAGYPRGISDCWTHAMTVRGSLDATVELALNRWDIAATEVIVEEAGGRCLIRPSRLTPGKFDTIFGSTQAVEEIAALLPF